MVFKLLLILTAAALNEDDDSAYSCICTQLQEPISKDSCYFSLQVLNILFYFYSGK